MKTIGKIFETIGKIFETIGKIFETIGKIFKTIGNIWKLLVKVLKLMVKFENYWCRMQSNRETEDVFALNPIQSTKWDNFPEFVFSRI